MPPNAAKVAACPPTLVSGCSGHCCTYGMK